jgi:hypothetical protein
VVTLIRWVRGWGGRFWVCACARARACVCMCACACVH